jgi:hypothetical protein
MRLSCGACRRTSLFVHVPFIGSYVCTSLRKYDWLLCTYLPSIRQHTSLRTYDWFLCSSSKGARGQSGLALQSVRQHLSAYVSIRQNTSAYVSIRQHTSAYVPAKEEPEVSSALLYGHDVVSCASVRRVPCFAVLVVRNKQAPQEHIASCADVC